MLGLFTSLLSDNFVVQCLDVFAVAIEINERSFLDLKDLLGRFLIIFIKPSFDKLAECFIFLLRDVGAILKNKILHLV